MTDHIKTVDLSNHTTLMECYIGLNKTCADLRAENERLREALKEVSVCLDGNRTGEDLLFAVRAAAAAIREGERK